MSCSGSCSGGKCDCSCENECYLQVGHLAPSFDVEGFFKGQKAKYSLKGHKGKWVILFFYPLDFTFVCPTELVELSKRHNEFEGINTQVLGMSVDSVYSHEAWLKELGELNYPLLSDITKEVSADYNVLIPEKGISLRGAFIIDPEGVLKCYMVNDLGVGRNVDELKRLISAFQTGDLCPVGWKPGEKTLGK
ncbi:peroxiredoxin [Candidatus Peregrinibacteria bacterium]|nr:peroxiredoxin [Candidatus Peregrinibacteria bacterium]